MSNTRYIMLVLLLVLLLIGGVWYAQALRRCASLVAVPVIVPFRVACVPEIR